MVAPVIDLGAGKLTTAIGSSNDVAESVVLQSDGKILVAGHSRIGTNDDFALVRYNADGSLDTSFDGDGKLTTAIGSSSDGGRSVVLQPDGKILVAGESYNGSNNDFALVRYNADGSLDTSFSGDGKLTTPIGSSDDFGRSVVLQPDGKILMAGYSYNGSNYDFALVRYNADGSLDTSFNGDGKLTTAIGSSYDHGWNVVLQPDGKIVVVGYSYNGSNDDFALVRYNSDGSLDTSFSGDGKLTTAIGTGHDAGLSAVVQPDGKILVAGYSAGSSSWNVGLVRYNSNGSLDTSFDGDGKVITAIGLSSRGFSVVLQPDGKILVAGHSWNGSDWDFALVRYNANGSLDTTFDGDGMLTTAIGLSDDNALSVVLQPDGKIVVAGSSLSSNNDFAVVRYNADGSLDTTFGAPTFVENGSAITLDTLLRLSDSDSTNLTGATITISEGFQAGDTFNFTNQNGITGNYSNGTLTLSGTATVAQYRTALRSITFSSTSDDPDNGGTNATRTITWVATDGTTPSTPVTSTLKVTAVNDAPVANAGPDYTVQQGNGLILDGTASFDPDDGIASYEWDLDDDSQFDDATGASPTLSWAQLQSLYTPGVANLIRLRVTDNSGATSIDTATLTVQANSAPTITGAPEVTTDEDTSYTFTAADFNFGDADAGDTLQSVTITGNATNGRLYYDATGGDPGDAVAVSAPQTISAADIAAGKLFFVPDADENGAGYATFTYTVSDGTDSSAPATMTIDVTAVNDAPVLTSQHDLGIVIANFQSLNVSVLTPDGADGFEANTLGTDASIQSPFFVALGDVDGDGFLDIVAPNRGNNDVGVLFGDGAGGFAPAITAAVGGGLGPVNAALGDLNGDGHLDIVTANQFSNDVSVLIGDGAGGFTASTITVPSGSNMFSVALGDLDNDGDLDIVTANIGTSTVGVLLGDGTGAFTASAISVGNAPIDIALGDINEDGTLDIVVANIGSSSANLMLGNGTGGFSITAFGASSSGFGSVALADMDGDGHLDAVLGASQGSNAIKLYYGNGAGGFTESPASLSVGVTTGNHQVALGDVDGDGDLDIIGTSEQGDSAALFRSDGAGGFTTEALPLAGGLRSLGIAVGDIGPTLVYTENDGPAAIEPTLTLSDIDSTTFAGGTVSITSDFVSGEDVLGFADQNGITGNYNASTGVLTLSGTASLADYQAALRSVTYANTSDNPSASPRVISIQVDDGSDLSEAAIATIKVTAVNDAPVLTGNLSSSVVEGGVRSIGAPDLGFTDPDDGPDDVTFTVSSQTNGTVKVNGVAQTTFTGTQLAAGDVTFTHDGSETTSASFAVSVEDGDEDGSIPVAQTFNLTVNPVNDAPVLTGDLSSNVNEGGIRSIGAPDLGFIDPDDDAASVTFTVSSQLNGAVKVNGVAQTTFTGTQLAAGDVTFTHDGSETTLASFAVSVDDGDEDGSTPVVQTFSLTVNPVNDAPTVAEPLGLATKKNQGLAINGFSVGDADNATLTVTLTAASTLTLSQLDGLTFTTGDGTADQSMTFSGAIADIDAALNGMTYTPTPNFVGAGGFDYTVDDGTEQTNGSVAIAVDALNFFAAPVTVYTSGADGFVHEVAAIDLDGDTDIDLLSGRFHFPLQNAAIPLEVLQNDGNGGFADGSSLVDGTLPGTVHPREFVVADFNGDGKDDLFIADHGFDADPFPGAQNQLLLSTPTGYEDKTAANLPAIVDYTHSATAADIDGDNDIDIFAGNIFGEGGVGPYFLINDGDGNFAQATDRLPAAIANLTEQYTTSALGDLDGDGLVDLYLGGNDGSASVILRNDGTGHFTSTDVALPTKPFSGNAIALDSHLIDLNGDNLLDIVTVFTRSDPFYTDRAVQVLINRGNFVFADETAGRIDLDTQSGDDWIKYIHFADFNGDGALDIITEPVSGASQILINDGDGFFFQPENGEHAFGGAFELGDFDGDGKPDILAWDGGSTNLRLLAGADGPDYPLIGGTGADTLHGDALANVMSGEGGNDTMYGGAGADDLSGGDDNDILDGGGGDDTLDGGDGTDTASYARAGTGVAVDLSVAGPQDTGAAGFDTLVSIENLTGSMWADSLTGDGGDNLLQGLADDDTLNGGDGNDILIGGLGADNLMGGDGDDTFRVTASEAVGDTYNGGDGIDTLQVLGGTALTLAGFNSGTASIEQWQGNDQGLFGTSGANVLNFSALADKTGLPFVDGGAGNDTITGSGFADTLRGGAGRDTLLGGLGSDLFDFNSITETKKGASRDKLMDFKRGQDDIDLRTIDATKGAPGHKFKWIGKQDFHDKKGELRYEDKGSKVIVQGDVNGDGKADFEIYVAVGSLSKGDFLL